MAQYRAYGEGFAKLAERLAAGSHVLVQGELQTREYERLIQIPSGKTSIDHKIQQLVVEVKADLIRTLDRSAKSESEAETSSQEKAPA